MKGKNEITLNQTTLVQAVQDYFEATVFQKENVPTVLSVQAIKGSGYSNSEDSPQASFLIKVEEKN